MKQMTFMILLLASLQVAAQIPVINIGDNLKTTDTEMACATMGESTDLASIVKDNGLLIIFSCNTCPFVVAWEDRYPMVHELAKANKVGFTLVNSNHTKRDGDDSPKAMADHAKKLAYEWCYLIDEESKLANELGAQTTPHVFLFDKNLKLVYKGAIDDNYKDTAGVKEFYLKDALNSLGSGKEIKVKETRNLGCSIKRPTS
ncbi:MAG: redoxin family protein [Prolixibacteraceae bacterium]|nr:redoxin family protein [Prolixibacteraceae bacterium]